MRREDRRDSYKGYPEDSQRNFWKVTSIDQGPDWTPEGLAAKKTYVPGRTRNTV